MSLVSYFLRGGHTHKHTQAIDTALVVSSLYVDTKWYRSTASFGIDYAT